MAYASRTCSSAEAKLGPTDGELLAIIYAVEKFHHLLAGTPFTVVTDHSALTHLNEGKTKNPKLARWAMRLAGYNFTIQHRAGRVHNNADGLSRSRAAPSPDTPGDNEVALEEATPDPLAFEAALEAFDSDPHLDGDPAPLYTSEATITPTLGPRQMLLEASPCTRCSLDIPADSKLGLVCDRCNKPYHLACLGLSAVPATYWYCPACAAHIAARGIACPTEDLQLQEYLLGVAAPPSLAPTFREAAATLTFQDQLYKWVSGQWLPYPPHGLQQLLLEEVHL